MIDVIPHGEIKRYFRATRKLNAPDFISHITQRAAGREPLFIEDDDYLIMLGLLKEISTSYALRVHAFCLMPNHTHILLNPSEENLYDAMRDLYSRYAMRFNRKYERKGHLFGGPYRQAVCLDDSYLLTASLYIHLNPARAGLVDDPKAYRWSSSRLFVEADAPESFVDPRFVLSLLDEDERRSSEKYSLLLEEGRGIKTGEVLEQEDTIDRLRTKIASIFPAIFSSVEKKRRIEATIKTDLLGFDEIERKIEEVKADPSSKPDSRQAKKFLIEQLISRGFKRKEIAERLGVSRKTVYNILRSP